MKQADSAVEGEMDAKQTPTNAGNQVMMPEPPPAKTCPGWRGPAASILACLGGGGLLIAIALAWGHWEFGSLASTLAYLNGERLLVDPGTLSFGMAARGEERDLHLTIRNRTGKEVKVLGARSTCGCMVTAEKFPLSIGDRGQQELTIHVWLTGKDSVFEKRVDFYTDDEANPVIPATIRGTITD
jgi:hypothetical protein